MLIIAYGLYAVIDVPKETVNKLAGHVYLDGDTLKLWEDSKAIAQAEGLTPTEYNECFYDWYDAVTGCGKDIEASAEFQNMLNTSIADYHIWN